MARYTGPVCKLCRREGVKLYLKGDRCYSPKCAIEKRPYAPGQHGQRRKGRPSDYSIRLREKQKLRRIYGVGERQFRNLFDEASRRKGVTGSLFLGLLESRLDSLVFRLGLAANHAQARQLVQHGHVFVDGKGLDVPSAIVKPGAQITVRPNSNKLGVILENVENARRRKLSPWLSFNPETLSGQYLRLPAREDLALPVNEQFVVEYYSR